MKNFRNFRRWPRLLLGISYLIAVFILFITIRNEYINIDASSASNNFTGGVAFGLSLVSEEPQTLLSSLKSAQKDNNWSASFLLQSQSPTVQVFIDYITIFENADQVKYCFTTFHLGKDINVPFEVVSEIQDASINDNSANEEITDDSVIQIRKLGSLVKSDGQSNEYVFQLDSPFCLDRGNKYYVPHLFLGVISSETFANLPGAGLLGFPKITGHRALEFFPFEQQKIIFNLDAHFSNDEGQFSIRPNLDISVSQQGWIGKFENVDGETILNLSRPSFYRYILIAFTLIMSILILFLNNIIDEVGGFFEIAFGLLLGLWGTQEILIPEYIGSSIPIDVIIYILYALVIGEIIAIFIDESFHSFSKRKVRITHIEPDGLENEYIEIENTGLLPVEMTRWVIFDQAMNKFKFPVFVLPGKIRFSRKGNKFVKVWTKIKPKDADQNHLKENLYWGRKQEVWNNNRDVAYLEDAKGEAIDTYPGPRRRKDDK